MRSVGFIHRGGPEMASYRYRAQVPADYVGASINGSNGKPVDIVVFSKPTPDDVPLAQSAKSSGAKIVLDLCDPHLHLDHYKAIFDLADVKVVPSQWTLNIVPGAVVIPDPYEFPELSAHCGGKGYLWFGHKTNLKDMDKWRWIPNLRVVSGPFDEVPEGITVYSPKNLHRALSEADYTIFPTRQGAEYKSNNRVLNAIRMGTFPICSQHPSFDEFKDFIWVGPIAEGLKWTRHHQGELNGLIRKAQDYIRDKYSPEAIGEKWKRLFESI